MIEINPELTPSWRDDLSNDAYHADKTAVSSSSLKLVLKSPLSFKNHFIDGVRTEPTKAMVFGTLVHTAVLEGMDFLRNYFIVPDFGDLRSSKNRAKRDEWTASLPFGAQVVTEQEMRDIEGMLNAVLRHKDAMRLLKDGVTEVSGYYADPVTGIKCRIRPDFLGENLGVLADLKTTVSCTLDDFSRAIWSYRYDFQMAMYAEGIRVITGQKIKYPAFIAVEKTPPYEVAVYVADDGMMDYGLTDYRRALDTLKKSLDSDVWPGYQEGVQNIALPAWIFNR